MKENCQDSMEEILRKDDENLIKMCRKNIVRMAELKQEESNVKSKLEYLGYNVIYMYCYGYIISIAYNVYPKEIICFFFVSSREDFSRRKARKVLSEKVSKGNGDRFSFPFYEKKIHLDVEDFDKVFFIAFVVQNRFLEYVLSNDEGLPIDMACKMRRDRYLGRYSTHGEGFSFRKRGEG
jgi:hypothetical protein